VVGEFFFDGVRAEPGGGAQAAGDGGAGAAFGFQFAGEGLGVGPASGEQGRDRSRHQPVNWRRSRVQASRVRPLYPVRNPARASRPESVNSGRTAVSAVEVDVVVVLIRHLLKQPEPRRRDRRRVPAMTDERNLGRVHAEHPVLAPGVARLDLIAADEGVGVRTCRLHHRCSTERRPPGVMGGRRPLTGLQAPTRFQRRALAS
jgi:hypothetical protein